MENGIFQSKHHLEAIFDSIKEPIFSISPDYIITRLNREYEQQVGKTFVEILGKTCYTQLYGRDDRCPDCPLECVLKEDKITSFKITLKNNNIYDVLCFPLKEKNGEISAMVEFARNITEKEKIRNELIILQQQTLHKSLQLSRYTEKLEIAYDKLNRELTRARIVQRGILPQKTPQLKELDTAVCYLPMAGGVGGDLYDFIQISPDLLGIILVDVSGHGIPAAFIAAMAKMSFYLHAMNEKSTARILTQVNKDMCSNLHMDEFFITTTYCIIDLITNRVKCSNAGHPPIYVYRSDKKCIEEINNKGFIMGLNDDAKYNEMEIDLKKGDRLIFYTDGVIESTNSDVKYGYDRFKEILLNSQNHPVKTQVDIIEKDLKSYIGDNETTDDITFVIMEAVLDNKFNCFKLNNEFETNNNVVIQAVRHPLEFESAIGNMLGSMDSFFYHDEAIRKSKFAIYEALNMYYHSGEMKGNPVYFAYKCDKDSCKAVIVDSRFFLEDIITPYYEHDIYNHSIKIINDNVDELNFIDNGKKVVLIKYNS